MYTFKQFVNEYKNTSTFGWRLIASISENFTRETSEFHLLSVIKLKLISPEEYFKILRTVQTMHGDHYQF